jgi:hypothetical protein
LFPLELDSKENLPLSFKAVLTENGDFNDVDLNEFLNFDT